MSYQRIPNRSHILIRAIVIMVCAGVLYAWAVFVKPLIDYGELICFRDLLRW